MSRSPIVGFVLLCAACGDGGRESSVPPPGEARVVEVWFSEGEVPVPRARALPDDLSGPPAAEGEAVIAAALRALLAGPTAEERAAGLGSWFSGATADALGEVERRDGLLRVDFRDLDRVIPGASSSAGSAQLLTSLDSTVFQFSWVDSVEYRLNGSCDAFWAWLQRECRLVRRR